MVMWQLNYRSDKSVNHVLNTVRENWENVVGGISIDEILTNSVVLAVLLWGLIR